ncbi:MAG: LytTR family DNA-binding domain-containing protein [Reichenbachiella sp.]|uniref:LytR/AlgR family response regulator transcription factor n=1 Tax=Reichenbachiella sp. TaxID=2184521 RepID=UPI0032642972
MRILIIEDEPLATQKLEALLMSIDPKNEIVGRLESVKETIAWLDANNSPDLAFVDVQLTDQNSFEIFRKRQTQFPIIFTTAYDKYILESFEYNTLDYLLKPIQEPRLRKALEKIETLESHFFQNKLGQFLKPSSGKTAKERFIVKRGIDYLSIQAKEVAYFFSEHKIVFLKDKKGNNFIMDRTLRELESDLDQKYFFRANRKYIVNISAIHKFKSDHGKVQLELIPEAQEDILVSKENAPAFRKWIAG